MKDIEPITPEAESAVKIAHALYCRNVKRLAKSRRISLAELGRRCGLQRSSLSRSLSPHHPSVSLRYVATIAHALGTSAAALLSSRHVSDTDTHANTDQTSKSSDGGNEPCFPRPRPGRI